MNDYEEIDSDIKNVDIGVIQKQLEHPHKDSFINWKDDETANGRAMLHCAAYFGRLDIVELLLEHGADMNITDKDGHTPLMYATFRGFEDIVKLLLDKGADINISDHQRNPVWMWALQQGRTNIVKLLLENGANINLANKKGTTALMWCLQRGYPDLVKLLMEKGAKINRVNSDGDNALTIAAFGGFLDVVDILLTQGADYEISNNDGQTVLHCVCLKTLKEEEPCFEDQKEQVASLLIDRLGGGSNNKNKNNNILEARCHKQRTPLHEAAISGYVGLVSLLLSHGANTKVVDSHKNIPVQYAFAKNGNLELARVFFQHETKTTSTKNVTLLHVACRFGLLKDAFGLLLNEKKTKEDIKAQVDAETCNGTTPLHLASEFGHMDIVRVLLNQGANRMAQDKDGLTPLHLACGNGHVQLAETLLDLGGVDIEAKERHGWTPLQVACQNNQLETVQLLLDRNANIHAGAAGTGTAAAAGGWTPLHIVCKFGCFQVAEFLLDQGGAIDIVNARNEKDWTPLHVACRYGQYELVCLLLDRGGADWTVQTANGRKSPEQLARKYGHVEIAEHLASLVVDQE